MSFARVCSLLHRFNVKLIVGRQPECDLSSASFVVICVFPLSTDTFLCRTADRA